MNYLKSLLQKSVADALVGLALTAINYGEAISILKKHFDNKKKLLAVIWTYCSL